MEDKFQTRRVQCICTEFVAGWANSIGYADLPMKYCRKCLKCCGADCVLAALSSNSLDIWIGVSVKNKAKCPHFNYWVFVMVLAQAGSKYFSYIYMVGPNVLGGFRSVEEGLLDLGGQVQTRRVRCIGTEFVAGWLTLIGLTN